jgi:hypothetical protein
MPTSYSNYTFEDLETILFLRQRKTKLFPENVDLVQPTPFLKELLKRNLDLPLATEKAKSELIVLPILNDLRYINHHSFTIFSGYSFDVDGKRALKGRSDFIISTDAESAFVRQPIVSIVAAKNDNLDVGIAQCIAQLYAAKTYNQRKKIEFNAIFGAVTTGFEWLFLRLDNTDDYYIDTTQYSFKNLPELLGVWQIIIDHYKPKS